MSGNDLRNLGSSEIINQPILTQEELNQKEENVNNLLNELGVESEKEINEDEFSEDNNLNEEEEFKINENDSDKEIRQKYKDLYTKVLALRGKGRKMKYMNKSLVEEKKKKKNKPEEEENNDDEEYVNQITEVVENLKSTQSNFEEKVKKLIEMSKESDSKLKEKFDKLLKDKVDSLNALISKKENNGDEDKKEELSYDELTKIVEGYKDKIFRLECKVNSLKSKVDEYHNKIIEIGVVKNELEVKVGNAKFFVTQNCDENLNEMFFQQFN